MDKKALVYKGMPPAINCCSQQLSILPNGEWIVIFQTGGNREPDPGNFVGLCRSTDQGETWGPLETVLKAEGTAHTMTETIVRDNELLLLAYSYRSHHDHWRSLVCRSLDWGRTWEAPQPFQPVPGRLLFRNVYVSGSGEWFMPFVEFPVPPGEDPECAIQAGMKQKLPVHVGVLRSGDRGRSWASSNLIDGRCWAYGNVVELREPGHMAMLIRADGSGCLWRSDSTDHGRTWSPAVRTDIPNPGAKFRLWRLRDGRHLLLHNPNSQTTHPNNKDYAWLQRNPLAIWVSYDDLRTWAYKRVLTDFPGMLAYPDGVIDAAEEYLHLVFDYNRHDVIYWGACLKDIPRNF